MRHPILELRDLLVEQPPDSGVVLSLSGNGVCCVATKNGSIPYRYTGTPPAVGDKVRMIGGIVSITKTPTEVYHIGTLP